MNCKGERPTTVQGKRWLPPCAEIIHPTPLSCSWPATRACSLLTTTRFHPYASRRRCPTFSATVKPLHHRPPALSQLHIPVELLLWQSRTSKLPRCNSPGRRHQPLSGAHLLEQPSSLAPWTSSSLASWTSTSVFAVLNLERGHASFTRTRTMTELMYLLLQYLYTLLR